MIKEFLLRLLQSCNPNAYADLTDEKMHSTCKHFFAQFFVFFIVMALLFIPAYFVHADAVQVKLNAFTNATLDGTFESDGPVTLIEQPTVIFNKNASSGEGAQLVLGNNEVFYKKYYWFGQDSVAYDDIKNLGQADAKLISMLAIFALPAIIFWAGLFVFIKFGALALILSFLGWVLVGAFRQKLTYKKALQVATYAAALPLALELILFPFWRNALVWLALYMLLFFIGAALLSDRKLKH